MPPTLSKPVEKVKVNSASQISAPGRIPEKQKDKKHHIDWNKALEDVDTARSRTVEYIGQALLDKYYLELRDPRVIYEVGRWLKERTEDTLHLNAFKSSVLVEHGIKREDVEYYLTDDANSVSGWLSSHFKLEKDDAGFRGGETSSRPTVWEEFSAPFSAPRLPRETMMFRNDVDKKDHSGASSREIPSDFPSQIQLVVEEALESTDLQIVTFDITWKLDDYVKEEMNSNQTLGDMITVTGAPRRAWATTCREYIQHTWPKTGPVTLQAVQKRLRGQSEDAVTYEGDFGIEILHCISNGGRFKVQGTAAEILQVAQQLVWLACTFQPGQRELLTSNCGFKALSPTRFHVELLPLQQDSSLSPSCWPPLFSGVLTPGFPVPEREDEVGVELTFEVMMRLACIQYAVNYGNAIAFKGWQTLLTPVSASPDFSHIQWHLACGDSSNDPKLVNGLSTTKDIRNWKTSETEEIMKARSFLGYARCAEISLGTSSFDAQSLDNKSGATKEESRYFWQRKFNLTLGTSGMGAFGVSAGGEIGFTKTQVAKMDDRDDFDRELDLAQRTPLLMYDVGKQTAWMVPKLSMMLHLVRSWFMARKDLADGEIDKLPSADLATYGDTAAFKAIVNHRDLRLKRRSDEGSWGFMSIVKDSLRILNACNDTEDREQSSKSVDYLLSWFRKPRLYGWDLADLVDARQSTYRKEVTIRANASDKWISHIGNDPDVLILFCNNIKAPVTVVSDDMCANWNPIPPGRNYLVAPTQCLRDLARHCDGNFKEQKLTEGCYWTRPVDNKPFNVCNYKFRPQCQRFHQIVTSPPYQRSELAEAGAFIFGTPAVRNVMACTRRAVKKPKRPWEIHKEKYLPMSGVEKNERFTSTPWEKKFRDTSQGTDSSSTTASDASDAEDNGGRAAKYVSVPIASERAPEPAPRYSSRAFDSTSETIFNSNSNGRQAKSERSRPKQTKGANASSSENDYNANDDNRQAADPATRIEASERSPRTAPSANSKASDPVSKAASNMTGKSRQVETDRLPQTNATDAPSTGDDYHAIGMALAAAAEKDPSATAQRHFTPSEIAHLLRVGRHLHSNLLRQMEILAGIEAQLKSWEYHDHGEEPEDGENAVNGAAAGDGTTAANDDDDDGDDDEGDDDDEEEEEEEEEDDGDLATLKDDTWDGMDLYE